MSIRTLSLCLLIGLTPLFSGCGGCGRPPAITMPSVSASSAASKAMAKYDANSDGKIDKEELEKAPALKAAIERIDDNGDGEIDNAEIVNEIREWQDSGLGRMSFNCYVTMGGKHLVGAKVRFVPEEFLGDDFQVAEGVTNKWGSANISIPGADPPGIAPGLYRVEITKDGVDIPAKYNVETIYGFDVSEEASQLRGETFFPVD